MQTNPFTFTALLTSVGVSVLLFGTGCGKKTEVAAPPPPAVTITKPEVREVTVFKSYPATLKGVNEVEIRARVSGYLVETNFKEGSYVKRGDHLFTIEQEPYELAVESAQADLERAIAGEELAKSRLKRLEEALKTNAVSEIEVDIASAELAQAVASVSQAKARLNDAKLDLSYTVVDAPIDGRVSLAMVDVENLVGYGEPTLVTTIVDDATIEAYFEVPEREVIAFLAARTDGKLAEYMMNLPLGLQLADRSEYSVPGKIDFLDNQVDPMTRTIGMRAVYANSESKLASGLFANVRIPVPPDSDNMKSNEALLVPASSVLRDIGGTFVWVVDAQNIVHRRTVETGDTVIKESSGPGQPPERQTIILDGLEPSESVILSGLQRARDGAPVTPTMK